ncbi:phosphate transport system permease protein [Catenuloplanes nepalensis]|uniref:Phosphate transport system permease protein PstA n=1 Tax=Catenuloplanes nepalensis TaxID=587533 RepID=A0ABT9N0M5_9ACTN|nr:phosphate ABC transporter permease PstA [Catenuloplanes nepalensis]MDP9797245.1 phosphate transport system permease protein [Catenuloplanes nepalensis]
MTQQLDRTVDLELEPMPEPRTVLPRPTGPVPVPRRLGGMHRDELFNLVGAAAAGVCTATLLFAWLAPFSGVLGFVIVAFAAFLVLYGLLTAHTSSGPAVRDRLWTTIFYSAAGLLMVSLGWVLWFTLARGTEAIFWHPNFFTRDLAGVGPLDPLTAGGVLHAMVGTLEMIAIALAVTVPLGVACAVYLTQVGGRGSRLVRTVVEAMTALPSIVAGLFVYIVIILLFGFPEGGLAASAAISIMMLPIIIRAADVVLRLVPGNLREAAEALGAPRWRTVWHVVLPTARSGLVTSVILGTARGIGETSPVLLTAGYTQYMNTNPLEEAMSSLPLVTYYLVRSGQDGDEKRAFGAAALLMVIVVLLFAIARLIGGRPAGRVTPRQAGRLTRLSARDHARMSRHQLGRRSEPLEILDEPQ